MLLVVDNTFASPYLQQPLNLGADVVVHSTTKYHLGRSDVVGGALVSGDAEVGERLAFHQNMGAVGRAFDAWLVLRGIKTLAVRDGSALRQRPPDRQFLAEHPAVDRILYPGLSTHRGTRSPPAMRDFGGDDLLRIARGDGAEVVAPHVASRWGSRSAGWSPSSSTRAVHPHERRRLAARRSRTICVRLSVGIENVEDLIDDLASALA